MTAALPPSADGTGSEASGACPAGTSIPSDLCLHWERGLGGTMGSRSGPVCAALQMEVSGKPG